jgi:hypothetical protein
LFLIAADIGKRQDDDGEEVRKGFSRRWRRLRRIQQDGSVDLERIDPDWLRDVLEFGQAEVGDTKIEPRLDLPIGVFRKAYRAGLGDAFEARSDIDAVAHQVAVALLDHVAEVDADAKLDAALRRQAGVTFDQASLDPNRAAHRIHHTAELDDASISGALDDPAVMGGDCRVDQIATEAPQARQGAVLVGSGEAAVSDDVGHQDCD